MLPGPVTRSAGSQTSSPSASRAPYANIATAWAPPTAYTSSTPSSAHAARIVGLGRPTNPGGFSRCAGLVTATEPTPASWAGTTFMTTLLGYTARPPGTYRPTRPTGTQRWVTVPPGTTLVVKSVGTCSRCTRRARRIDSSRPARTSG